MNLTQIKKWIEEELQKRGNDFINWKGIKNRITEKQFQLVRQIIALYNQEEIFGNNNKSNIKFTYNLLENLQ